MANDLGDPIDPSERIVWGIRSARARRVHWALIELALPYRTIAIETRTPAMESEEFLAVNPRKKIPALQDDGMILTESPAIVTYLAERYSNAQRRLIPEAWQARARYFEWLSFIAMELDATSLYVLRRHEGLAQIYGEAPAANAAARAYFSRMITSATLALDDGRRFLLGEDFTGVDILMTTCLDWALKYGLPLPAAFNDYRDRVAERPSYGLALAANEPS